MSAPEQHHLTRSPFVGYSRFAVAGVGVLGRAIAERLSALPGTSVVALTRRDEVSLAEGAEAVQVDYSDEELLVRVLGEAKTEVFISTLSGGGLHHQDALARSAKRAGVALFLPSEFGNPGDSDEHTPDFDMPWMSGVSQDSSSPANDKRRFHALLRKLDLPMLRVHNWAFTDVLYNPELGFDFANRKVEIVGSGDNPIPQTTREDLARFLAHVLTTMPAHSFTDKTFLLGADVRSLNYAVETYERLKKVKLDVTRIPHKEAEETLMRNPQRLVDYVKLEWDTYPPPSEENLANSLWPEWNPKSVEQVIAGLP